MCTPFYLLTADMPSITVYAGQHEVHSQPTVHSCTTPDTFEYTIPDEIIRAKKDYTVVVNCDNESVNVSFTAAKCSCK